MTDSAHLASIRGLSLHLASRIRGQDHLLPRLASGFGRAALSLPDPRRPAASFLLVGPTGSGKSLSFEVACNYTFGPDRLAVFDMSEYQDHSAVNKLLGESRDDPGLLGQVLGRLPSGGLLFDEIEKAHSLVMDLFLQMLERGCITVATGTTYPMGGYVVGFTSNIGAADAMRMAHSTFASIEQATLRRVGQSLRPELISRLDEQLVFSRLDPEVQREICALEVASETSRLQGQGYDLAVSREAMDFLMREGFHPQLGARRLRNAVASHLQDAVLRSLLNSGLAHGTIVVDPAERRLVVCNR
jgi:ATP-dependent Clp protease ATP-binding subunit ClpA